METAPLKSFATLARTALIREVTARVAVVLAPASPERVEQPQAVDALEKAVSAAGGGDKGRTAVADRVAYTWFNRVIALRFMDANGYTGTGVVSPHGGVEGGQPEILAEAKHGNIDTAIVGTRTRETVTGLLNGTRRSADPQGEAYALLLADYCRHWNRAMPFMFEREGDFSELLVPANLLADDSVLNRAVKVLTADVCKDVEVIGWLYQFYISERKDEVFAGFKKNKKAGAAEIPAATQLFTPHWIVRYLVENSLGRLWMLNRPSSRLIHQMDYYIAPVDDEAGFLKITNPEELRVIDPACGSGHMLTYAFDLLYAIYEEEGYAPSEIPGLILANNLYGTEIDPRAGALAAFALTMKAREKQRTFFNKQVEPNVCVLEPISFGPGEIDFLVTRGGDRREEIAFWNQFAEADTLGSLIKADPDLTARLARHLETLDGGGDILKAGAMHWAARVVAQAAYLTPRYATVVANPPYMGKSNMGDLLARFAETHYPRTKADFYGMFMERASALVRTGGAWGVIAPHGWMFQSSFAGWRGEFLRENTTATLVQFGRGVFGSDWASAAFVVLRVCPAIDRKAIYRKLYERALDVRSREFLEQLFLDPTYQSFIVRQQSFLQIDGSPIAFSLGQPVLDLLAAVDPLSAHALPRQGLATGDNDRFLRFWWEVSNDRITRSASSSADVAAGAPWVPYLKGGPPRRWTGNDLHVIYWANDGYDIRNFFGPDGRQRSVLRNTDSYFRAGMTWSTIAGEFAMRDVAPGAIFDSKGSLLLVNDEEARHRLLGYLNSSMVNQIIATLSPTLDFSQGPVGRIPVPDGVTDSSGADGDIAECVVLSREDWSANEVAADFRPRVGSPAQSRLGELFTRSMERQREIADRMLALERGLDKHFGELAGGVVNLPAARPVTLNAADLRVLPESAAFASLARDLVSFAVGCMFGRYSLDEPGLILADQGTTLQDYLANVPTPSFTPDADNVIPIVDGDWFEDDMVSRFRQFLRAAFGQQHFEENLRFVTESLGVKDLRDYFVKSFYKDHVQRYKKRPIYWLFSSPKGSFNALVYMHRYTPSTVSTVLNEYLREFKAKLESSLQHQDRLAAGGGTPRHQAVAQKEADRLRKVLLELDEYEHDVLYPLASQQLSIDLDDGVKVNYPKFGAALKNILVFGQAMSEAATVRPHLERWFERRRVVFWHDPDGQYTADLDGLDLPGVQTVCVANDEYGIKSRLLRDEPTSKFLVYRSGQVPTGTGNWLLDLELAYGVFTADRAALVAQDLGLTGERIDEVVQAHEKFFNATKRVESLKVLLSPEDDAKKLRAKITAVVLGQREHSLLEITRTLLTENAKGLHGKYDALVNYGLDDFYWRGVASIYGYESASPGIDDLVLWIFRKAIDSFKSDRPGGLHNIQLDFASLRNDRRSQNALATLARRAARDLGYASMIEDASFRDLEAIDLFEETDQKIISDLARAVAEQAVTSREVSEVVRARQSSVWIDGYRQLYTAVVNASELLSELGSLDLVVQSFDDGLERYRREWFRIDQLYRQFVYAARTAEYPKPLEALQEQIEKRYTNKFVYELGNAWEQQVDEVGRWRSSVLRSQTSFYAGYVGPLVRDGEKKAVVIISDALRYEVADELGSRIRQEDRFDATLDAVLGVLPSYTQLGMAALLPHSTLKLSVDAKTVLADDQPTNSTAFRRKILESVGGTAIQAEDFKALNADERRELYKANRVLYVYHNRIDAIGDKPGTERQVFEAVEDTLRDIVNLVKKLASANATNIFITADHGFLFQDEALAGTFFLSTQPQGDDIKVVNRRYVLGHGLKVDNAFVTFDSAQLGLRGDLEVQIPKSIHRLRLAGGGSRFVHGGAMLQEIVVPVLAVNKKRKSDTRLVNVEVWPESDKITTGQVVVRLFQSEPASEKVQPRTLRAGLYVGETVISNLVNLTFDQTSADKRDRYQSARMLLTQEANDYNNRAVEFRLEERISNTNQWRVYARAMYTLKRSFSSDFDF